MWQDIPAAFVRDHGEQMKPSATIQAAGDGDGGQVWPVRVHIVATPFRARVGFSQGFHEFLLANDLNVGDQLIFSLPAMSKFVVYTFKLHNIKAGRRSMAAATPSIPCTPSKKERMPIETTPETIVPAHHHYHPVKVEFVKDLDAKRGREMMSDMIKEKIRGEGEYSWSVNRQIVDEEPESEEEEEKEEEEGGEIRSSQISFRKVVSASSASVKHGTPVCFSRLVTSIPDPLNFLSIIKFSVLTMLSCQMCELVLNAVLNPALTKRIYLYRIYSCGANSSRNSPLKGYVEGDNTKFPVRIQLKICNSNV